MTELSGARVLVTGASGGLGRAIAKTLRARGSELVVTGRRTAALEKVASEVSGRAIVADLADREQLHRLLREAGQVDVLVANAALPGSGRLETWSEEQVDRVMEVNLLSPMHLARALLPDLLERGRGHLVFISSINGIVAARASAIYASSKFGIRGFAGSIRCDLHGTPVGCSVIFPGFVRDAGMFADTGARLPRGVGTVSPADVASAVARAITTNRAEVSVAPLSLRLGATMGGLAPAVSAAVQSWLDRGLSDRMVAAQSSKR